MEDFSVVLSASTSSVACCRFARAFMHCGVEFDSDCHDVANDCHSLIGSAKRKNEIYFHVDSSIGCS